jgi:hypothetical protein
MYSLLDVSVDMLSLSTALEQFDSHGLRAQNDKLIDIPDMVTVLTSLYEVIAADNPAQISVPLCIDLAINWLLNVYDRYAKRLCFTNTFYSLIFMCLYRTFYMHFFIQYILDSNF